MLIIVAIRRIFPFKIQRKLFACFSRIYFVAADQTMNMKMLMGKSCETRTAEVNAMNIMISCIRTAMVLVGLGFLILKLTGKTDAFSIVLYVLAGIAVLIGIAEYAILRSSLEECECDRDR